MKREKRSWSTVDEWREETSRCTVGFQYRVYVLGKKGEISNLGANPSPLRFEGAWQGFSHDLGALLLAACCLSLPWVQERGWGLRYAAPARGNLDSLPCSGKGASNLSRAGQGSGQGRFQGGEATSPADERVQRVRHVTGPWTHPRPHPFVHTARSTVIARLRSCDLISPRLPAC